MYELSLSTWTCVPKLVLLGSAVCSWWHLYGIEHFQTNGAPFLSILDQPSFSRSNFCILLDLGISRKRFSANFYCHQIGSSVFAIKWCHCECCTSRPWPTFQGHKFWNENISTTTRTSDECLSIISKVDFCRRMGPLHMLHPTTFNLISMIKPFLVMHFL